MKAGHATTAGATGRLETATIPGDLCQGIPLQCPRCKAGVAGLDCRRCGFSFHVTCGIVHALPPERVVHYARFVEEYERIRNAEGRGSENEDFYLGLPYLDVSGNNSEQWKIRACTYEHLTSRVLARFVPAGRGRILDLGAGNCWMSYRLSLAGYSPVAVDLITNNRDGLGAGSYYQRHVSQFFPRFRAEFSHLPFRSNKFDAAIFNASFHYSEDYEQALSEALRCVKHGGAVIIGDTPWYSCDDSGERMLAERRARFLDRYGTASDSIRSLEYLTDARLRDLARRFSIQWQVYCPEYGFKWAARPLVARLRGRREPARFRIYAAQKAAT